ncbi:HAD family hydrolase [Paucidesulfovibrio longus]|uniref:HAD family hydrolase n=1 Tax=Paucidesulfovibrio longus TaxID=889 RepID=UPI0003B60C61|nr:HAD family hydrolase [Paucidesulfovibrio longus]
MPNPTVSPQARAVIFDCDGVLIDSWNAALHFFNSMRRAVDLGPLNPDEERACFVRTIPESLDLIIPAPLRAEAQRAWDDFDLEEILELVRPQPGIGRLLERLRAAGRGLAVCTNGGAEQHPILEHLDLRDHFDHIVTAEDTPRGKPWPDGSRDILRRFGLGPEEALFVGDSHVDEETARNAGIPFWAYRNPALNAQTHVRDFDEVVILERA